MEFFQFVLECIPGIGVLIIFPGGALFAFLGVMLGNGWIVSLGFMAVFIGVAVFAVPTYIDTCILNREPPSAKPPTP